LTFLTNEPVVRVEHIGKKFCRSLKRSLWYGVRDVCSDLYPFATTPKIRGDLRHGEFWALRDVSFELRRGECLGLVGSNGAGKTTLLKMLAGLIKPDEGRIEMRGHVGGLIALGAGFNPVLTGRENIYVNGAVLGLKRAEIDDRLDEIIEFAELSDSIDSPVRSYSSGMQVRLGFAVATTLKPDVLLLDEVLAVGDVAFRGKCFKRVGEMLAGAAVIFVTHNEAQVRRICDRAMLLDFGTVRYAGNPSEVLRRYRDRSIERVPSLRLVAGNGVTAFGPADVSSPVEWGTAFSVRVRLRLDRPVCVGHVIVHFAKDGEFVAHAEARHDSHGALNLCAGDSVLSLTIGRVQLVHGLYHLSLSMFNIAGKETVLQAFDFAPVAITGPVGVGPSQLLPMTVSAQRLSL
jgi:lipopolysaccharide transport system ATP-binding protein